MINSGKYKFAVSLRGRLVNVTPIVDPHIKKLYKKYFPKIDLFHAVSNHIKQEAIKYGASPDKIFVIYSSVKADSTIKLQIL